MRPYSSYAPISASANDDDRDTTTTIDTRLGGLQNYDHHDAPRFPPSAYHHLEAARGLSWTDPFYDGKHGIVAAFDRDAERAGNKFLWRFLRTACFLWGLSGMYWILGAYDKQYSTEESILDDIFGVYTLILGAFFALLALRGRQAMLSQHVALTTEGIRVDNGTMVSITIPLEHIQKVIVAPYQFCCRKDPDFFTVSVHREAAPLEQLCFQKTKTMELYGIIRAQEFANLVRAMKDSHHQGTYEGLDENRLELQTIPSRTSTPAAGSSTAAVVQAV